MSHYLRIIISELEEIAKTSRLNWEFSCKLKDIVKDLYNDLWNPLNEQILQKISDAILAIKLEHEELHNKSYIDHETNAWTKQFFDTICWLLYNRYINTNQVFSIWCIKIDNINSIEKAHKQLFFRWLLKITISLLNEYISSQNKGKFFKIFRINHNVITILFQWNVDELKNILESFREHYKSWKYKFQRPKATASTKYNFTISWAVSEIKITDSQETFLNRTIEALLVTEDNWWWDRIVFSL